MASEPTEGARHLLRHTVATLAYRAQKALTEAPASFVTERLSAASRTPLEIVAHMGDLVEWAERMAKGEYRWAPEPVADWNAARDRFFTGLAALDAAIAESKLTAYSADVIFQGPIADALTHVGQLAMMRGIAGAPMRPESYARAEIQVGRVGVEQSTVRKEFDGDASRARR